MSFGGGEPTAAHPGARSTSRSQRGVVLVAAASNDPDTDQGAPASQLQPGDAAADRVRARGSWSPASTSRTSRRAPAAGRRSRWPRTASSTACAAVHRTDRAAVHLPRLDAGRGAAVRSSAAAARSFDGDERYAYLEGTSMAAPQVTATAAMIGELNPLLTAAEKIRLIKETARRSGGWTPELGWGILDAGRAVDAARRIDKDRSGRAAPGRAAACARRAAGRARAARARSSGPTRPGRPGSLPSGVAVVRPLPEARRAASGASAAACPPGRACCCGCGPACTASSRVRSTRRATARRRPPAPTCGVRRGQARLAAGRGARPSRLARGGLGGVEQLGQRLLEVARPARSRSGIAS